MLTEYTIYVILIWIVVMSTIQIKWNWFDSFSHHISNVIVDFQSTEFSETPSPDSDSVNSLEGHSEPSWFKDIKFDDSDTEQLADENDFVTPSKYPMTADIL